MEEKIVGYETKIKGISFFVEDAQIAICKKCDGKVFDAKEVKRWEQAYYEDRKTKAYRLASYLWHLSLSVGKGRLKGNKETQVRATAEHFLSDKNWPYPETTVPPAGFEDE